MNEQKKEEIIEQAPTAALKIEDTDARIRALSSIAPYLEKQKKEMLEEVLSVAFFIKDDYYRAKAIHIVISCLRNLPLNNLYFWWREIIQILRERTRDNLFLGIATFTPIIDELGKDEILFETYQAITDVSRWWP